MKKPILGALVALTLPACLGSAIHAIRTANDRLGSVAAPAYRDAQAVCEATKKPLVEAGDVLGLQKAIDTCNSTLKPLERVAELQKQIDEALANKDVERANELLVEALDLWRARSGK